MRRTVQPVDAGCSLVFFDLLDQQSAERMASALRVVADPARLRILSLVANHPDGEVCQAQFTAPLGLSQPTVSHHLKVLHDAGLLRREQRGSWAYYSIERDRIESLRSALATRR
jgi:ArsR family transcriptional regulator